ncbi:hypothetical protein DFH06DRAFT_1382684 [Mycena polygramma]|nr:hypothetical protein DFH06DRAFT_1382684 [Mycena polygramma]
MPGTIQVRAQIVCTTKIPVNQASTKRRPDDSAMITHSQTGARIVPTYFYQITNQHTYGRQYPKERANCNPTASKCPARLRARISLCPACRICPAAAYQSKKQWLNPELNPQCFPTDQLAVPKNFETHGSSMFFKNLDSDPRKPVATGTRTRGSSFPRVFPRVNSRGPAGDPHSCYALSLTWWGNPTAASPCFNFGSNLSHLSPIGAKQVLAALVGLQTLKCRASCWFNFSRRSVAKPAKLDSHSTNTSAAASFTFT